MFLIAFSLTSIILNTIVWKSFFRFLHIVKSIMTFTLQRFHWVSLFLSKMSQLKKKSKSRCNANFLSQIKRLNGLRKARPLPLKIRTGTRSPLTARSTRWSFQKLTPKTQPSSLVPWMAWRLKAKSRWKVGAFQIRHTLLYISRN